MKFCMQSRVILSVGGGGGSAKSTLQANHFEALEIFMLYRSPTFFLLFFLTKSRPKAVFGRVVQQNMHGADEPAVLERRPGPYLLTFNGLLLGMKDKIALKGKSPSSLELLYI